MKETVIIIGTGQAGGMAAIYLRQKKYSGNIIIIGEEDYLPYQRPPLSKSFLSNQIDISKLFLKTADYYSRNNIKILTKTKVIKIIKANKYVITNNNEKINYDHLIIATGSSLNKFQSNNKSIFYLKTLNDSLKIRKQLKPGKTLSIIGGGYIGLELASIAVKNKINVTILESDKKLMGRVVSKEVSSFFENKHRSMGVSIKFNSQVTGIEKNDNGNIVICNDGSEYSSDLVFAGIGVKPNIEIAADAGIKCDNGISVNEYGQTSDESIYAAGDCTNHPNTIFNTKLRLESVHNAIEQSKTVANKIIGINKSYNQVPWFWSDQYNLKLQIAGIHSDDNVRYKFLRDEKSLSVVYLRDSRIICVESVNRPQDFIAGKKLILSQKRIPNNLIEHEDCGLKEILKKISINS